MTLEIWLLFSATIGLLFRSNVLASVIVITTFWALVPGYFQLFLLPKLIGFPQITAGSWLIFVVLIFQIGRNSLRDNRKRIIPAWAVFTLLMTIGIYLTSQIITSGFNSISYFLNQIVAPLAFFWLARVGILQSGHKGILQLRNLLLFLVFLEFSIVLLVFTKVIPQPFVDTLSLQHWYTRAFSVRQLGTLDHPLVLSVLFVVAIPLTASLKQIWLQISLIFISLAGIALTQSRAGLILAVIALVYLIFLAKSKPLLKFFLAMGLIVATYFVFVSEQSLDVLGRFNSDGGSAQARLDAAKVAILQIQNSLIIGHGPGTSYTYAAQSGLATSFENPFFMLTIDFGFLGTLLYFGTQFILTIRSKNAVPGIKFGTILAIVCSQSFSSVTSSNFVLVLIWLLVAMSMGANSPFQKTKLIEFSRPTSGSRQKGDLIQVE